MNLKQIENGSSACAWCGRKFQSPVDSKILVYEIDNKFYCSESTACFVAELRSARSLRRGMK